MVAFRILRKDCLCSLLIYMLAGLEYARQNYESDVKARRSGLFYW